MEDSEGLAGRVREMFRRGTWGVWMEAEARWALVARELDCKGGILGWMQEHGQLILVQKVSPPDTMGRPGPGMSTSKQCVRSGKTVRAFGLLGHGRGRRGNPL